ncbi:hypothetical protein F2P79_024093 [Pimephales promelas]|nr:hypothetical protein F2P79_024093 [Pimephales promelas]
MKCFVCGEFGHVRQTCPGRDRPAPAADADNSERAAGADVAVTAVASEPQPDGAISAAGDLPEGGPVLGASGDGLETAVEEETGPSHAPAVTQTESGPGRVVLPAMSENKLFFVGKQTKPDGIENDTINPTDDSLKPSKEDILSQESVDLMDDSDNEHDYTEMMGNDAEDSEFVSDLKLFLLSGSMAMRKASLEELDKPKRYRLKKLLSNETHTDENNQIQWQSEWKGQAILSHGSNVSAGVAILLTHEYKEQPVNVLEIISGRLLRVDITVQGDSDAESLKQNKFLLRNLLEERAQDTLIRARFASFNSMDSPTSFFFNFEKKTVDKKILGCLKLSEGRKVNDAHTIISYALSFYEDLYRAEPCDEEMVEVLFKDLPQLSEGEKIMLDKPLTFDELSIAVN